MTCVTWLDRRHTMSESEEEVVADDAGGAHGDDGDDSDDSSLAKQPPDELYDDAADDKDEAWATKQRQGRQSAAILSCPCCLDTVCMDCQQHEVYHNQFRAMFVRNCKVVTTEVLRTDTSSARAPASRTPPVAEVYHPVHCATCNTHIGVRDADEVFHFFNVVATNA